ncbi:MAG: multidrug efflux SMR transporter [Hyphomicrobiaceae bacterium]
MSNLTISWILLFSAGMLEVATTTVFRFTDGLTRVVPTVTFFALGIASFYLLYKSLAAIPLGTAYAVWTGIGAAGTALIGILFYAEPATTVRLVLLSLLIGSIMGLKLIANS